MKYPNFSDLAFSEKNPSTEDFLHACILVVI